MIHTDRELREFEAFIFHEVYLLDERRWEEWLALFTDDGDYWVPMCPGDEQPWENLSLMYEDRDTMEIRLIRYRHPLLHAQTPPSRASHLVSNIVLLEANDKQRRYLLRAQFTMSEYRQEKRHDWAGTFYYELGSDADSLKIKRKKVLLVDSEAVLGTIQVPF